MEGLITLQILRGEALDLFPCTDRVAIIIEEGAVIEIDAIERQNWHDFQIFSGVKPARDAFPDPAVFVQYVGREIRLPQHRMVLLKAEQFFDEVRDGQHRRTHIEHKAIGPANIGAAARCIERFNDFCIKA